MKMLCFSRPWLWSILELSPDKAKRVENRTWKPPIEMIGHRIALHSAKSWDDDAMGFFLRLGLDGMPGRKELYPHSAVLGVATIDRVVTIDRTLPDNQKRWFFGPCGWILTDVIKLDIPVPCKGAQGLRELPPEVNSAVFAQLAVKHPERFY